MTRPPLRVHRNFPPPPAADKWKEGARPPKEPRGRSFVPRIGAIMGYAIGISFLVLCLAGFVALNLWAWSWIAAWFR